MNGYYRIGLFALRGIHEGEELTYDYNWDAFEFDNVTVCCCGATNCRHFLNKHVIMNNREKELARTSRLLLLRNLRKSAAWKLKKFRNSKFLFFRNTALSSEETFLLVKNSIAIVANSRQNMTKYFIRGKQHLSQRYALPNLNVVMGL